MIAPRILVYGNAGRELVYSVALLAPLAVRRRYPVVSVVLAYYFWEPARAWLAREFAVFNRWFALRATRTDRLRFWRHYRRHRSTWPLPAMGWSSCMPKPVKWNGSPLTRNSVPRTSTVRMPTGRVKASRTS